jgi:hypothetical protein
MHHGALPQLGQENELVWILALVFDKPKLNISALERSKTHEGI